MSGLKTGPATKGLQVFAIPAVCILITILGHITPWLLNHAPDLAPGPLSKQQTITFNTLLACVWYTYYKVCTVDPGRYPALASDPESSPPRTPPGPASDTKPGKTAPRWCKKCRAPKPLRAHHCRHCSRCIPKMDHHCPWTGNCVSMQTFPYFIRFLLYTNIALWNLNYFVLQRMKGIWSERHLPAYLGPTLPQLIFLTIISLVSAATTIALGVLLFTTIRGWVFNSTMIEDWEVERHEAVLARLEGNSDSSASGDFWGADGESGVLLAHLNRIEFPYDLGFFSNMGQAMGTSNPMLWFFPFAGGPTININTPGKGTGWEWEENGFNDLPGMWPPPDPEKLRRAQSGWPGAASRVEAEETYYKNHYDTPEDAKAAFAQRQLADIQRRRQFFRAQAQEYGIVAELEETDVPDEGREGAEFEWEGSPVWTNAEGDRLWDYGVDEDVEQDDGAQHVIPLEDEDEDVPIAELIRRRRVLTKEQDD